MKALTEMSREELIREENFVSLAMDQLMSWGAWRFHGGELSHDAKHRLAEQQAIRAELARRANDTTATQPPTPP